MASVALDTRPPDRVTITGSRPDGRWKLMRVPVFVEVSAARSRLLFQRPSGREPLRTDAPVVCPKRQTTGYCPAPIRAKANSESPKFHPPFMRTCAKFI
ncbi:MAG: hypothetical protein HY774_04980 [Acidobacteria bacterium]|nr:hypothetical protein [Acidobacteriota bacterium]